MPCDDEGLAGLFIPTGERSRSSSTETSSTSRLTTTSSIIPFDSASTTEGSSIRTTTTSTTTTSTTKSSTFVPSSGVRYTISASAIDTHGYTHRSSANVNNAITAAKPQWHNIRGPAQPPLESGPKPEHIVHVPHTVKAATTKSSMAHSLQSPELQTFDSDELHEQSIRVTAPTPFTSPETTAGPDFQGHNITNDESTSSTGPIVANLSKNLGMIPAQQRSRSQSPGSSHSSKDRTFPPGSFPSKFYQNLSAPNETWGSSAQTPNVEINSKPVRPKAIVYTISGPARSADHFPDALTATPQHSRIERSTSDRMVVRASKSSKADPPKLLRSSSSSSRSSTLHRTIHYYRSCLHSSPPTTRPLDVQPVIERSISCSSEYRVSTRSIIEGSCFDCDTSSRRDAETQVLLKHAPELSDLIAETRYLLNKLELGNPDQDEFDGSIYEETHHGKSSDEALLKRQSTNDENEGATSGFFALQIYDLESRIAQLTDLRDREVRRVWRGYTSRWGPGTLGVVQKASTKTPDSASGRSVSRARTTPMTQSSQAASPFRERKRDRSRGSVSSHVTNSTNTTGITYGNDETPEGRMRVNWIRD